jgi:hypothetical protein
LSLLSLVSLASLARVLARRLLAVGVDTVALF